MIRLDSATGPLYSGGLGMLRGEFRPDVAPTLEILTAPQGPIAEVWMLRDLVQKSVGAGKDLRSSFLKGEGAWRPASANTQPQLDGGVITFQFRKDDGTPQCHLLRVRQGDQVSNPILVNEPRLWFALAEERIFRPGQWARVYGKCMSSTPYHDPANNGTFYLRRIGGVEWVKLQSEPAYGQTQDASYAAADFVRSVKLPDDLMLADYELVVVQEPTVLGVSNAIRIAVDDWAPAQFWDPPLAIAKLSLQATVDQAGEQAKKMGVHQILRLGPGVYLLDKPLVIPPNVGLAGAVDQTIIASTSKFSIDWRPWEGCYVLSSLIVLQSKGSLRNLKIVTNAAAAPVCGVNVWHVADGPGGVGQAAGVTIQDCTIDICAGRPYVDPPNPPHAACAIMTHSPTRGLTIVGCKLSAMEGILQPFGARAEDFYVAHNHFRPAAGGRLGVTAWGGISGVHGVLEHNIVEDSNRGIVAQGWAGPIAEMAVVGNVFRGGVCNYGQGESSLWEFPPGDTFIDSDKIELTYSGGMIFSSWPNLRPEMAGQTAVVVSGPGRGQWRRIVTVDAMQATLERDWDVQPTAASRVIVGNMPTDVVSFANRYESSKGGWMIGEQGCGFVSIADEWFNSRDGAYILGRSSSGCVFDVSMFGPTFVNSSLSLIHDDNKAAIEGAAPVISGVNVQFGRFAASPIFAAAYRGLEGLLLCETDFDDGWGAPGHTYVQADFERTADLLWEPVLAPSVGRRVVAAQRLERCRHNNLRL